MVQVEEVVPVYSKLKQELKDKLAQEDGADGKDGKEGIGRAVQA